MSPFSAREAVKLGHNNVKVLSSGLPHEEDSYVLVDLRSPEAAKAGHIKDAVSFPADQLAGAKDKFPVDKSAPVILYNVDQASEETFALVRGWGYKNASVLDGGAKAWDGKFFPGEPATEIVYVKKLKPGQITIEEFRQIATAKPSDKVILDVRDSGAEGLIPGAVNIPEGQLAARLGELSKDKEYIIHCNTGILAGMALKILQDHGYQARYLDAVVQVGPDNSFDITEK
jgi:rhodanese-related sulfurtransferase